MFWQHNNSHNRIIVDRTKRNETVCTPSIAISFAQCARPSGWPAFAAPLALYHFILRNSWAYSRSTLRVLHSLFIHSQPELRICSLARFSFSSHCVLYDTPFVSVLTLLLCLTHWNIHHTHTHEHTFWISLLYGYAASAGRAQLLLLPLLRVYIGAVCTVHPTNGHATRRSDRKKRNSYSIRTISSALNVKEAGWTKTREIQSCFFFRLDELR